MLPGRPGDFARSAAARGGAGSGKSLVKPTKKTPASAPCRTSLPCTGSTALQVSCVGTCGVETHESKTVAEPPSVIGGVARATGHGSLQPRYPHKYAPKPRSARSAHAAHTPSSGAKAPRRRRGSTASGGCLPPGGRVRICTTCRPAEAAGPRPETAVRFEAVTSRPSQS